MFGKKKEKVEEKEPNYKLGLLAAILLCVMMIWFGVDAVTSDELYTTTGKILNGCISSLCVITLIYLMAKVIKRIRHGK